MVGMVWWLSVLLFSIALQFLPDLTSPREVIGDDLSTTYVNRQTDTPKSGETEAPQQTSASEATELRRLAEQLRKDAEEVKRLAAETREYAEKGKLEAPKLTGPGYRPEVMQSLEDRVTQLEEKQSGMENRLASTEDAMKRSQEMTSSATSQTNIQMPPRIQKQTWYHYPSKSQACTIDPATGRVRCR